MEKCLIIMKEYWYIPAAFILVTVAAFSTVSVFSKVPEPYYTKDELLKILNNIDYCDVTIRRSHYLNAAWKEIMNSKEDVLPYADGNYIASVAFYNCKKNIPMKILQSLHVFELLAGINVEDVSVNLENIYFDQIDFLRVFSLKKSKIKNYKILFNLDKLRSVTITKSDFPFSELEDLKEALPNTKIFYSEYDYFQWQRKNE